MGPAERDCDKVTSDLGVSSAIRSRMSWQLTCSGYNAANLVARHIGNDVGMESKFSGLDVPGGSHVQSIRGVLESVGYSFSLIPLRFLLFNSLWSSLVLGGALCPLFCFFGFPVCLRS